MQALSVASEINGSKHVQTVINCTTATNRHNVDKANFKGIFAVISNINDDFEYMYMGAGYSLASNGITIESQNNMIAASITKTADNQYSVSSDGDCLITIDYSLSLGKNAYLIDNQGNKKAFETKSRLFSKPTSKISMSAGYDYTLTIE